MRKIALCVTMITAVALTQTVHATVPQGKCGISPQDERTCQYDVPSNHQAWLPDPSRGVSPGYSQGIRLDGGGAGGVTNALFYSYAGLCRFYDNKSGSDIFVPQGSVGEFQSFIKRYPVSANDTAGIFAANCVLPQYIQYNGSSFTIMPSGYPAQSYIAYTTYEITSNDMPVSNIIIPNGTPLQPSHATPPVPLQIPLPQQVSPSSSPVVNSVVRVPYTAPMPTATLTSQSLTSSVPIVFNYIRMDCNSYGCNSWPIEEVQTITLTASQPGGTGTDAYWANPQVSSAWWVTISGVLTPLSDTAGGPTGPTFKYMPPSPPVCTPVCTFEAKGNMTVCTGCGGGSGPPAGGGGCLGGPVGQACCCNSGDGGTSGGTSGGDGGAAGP